MDSRENGLERLEADLFWPDMGVISQLYMYRNLANLTIESYAFRNATLGNRLIITGQSTKLTIQPWVSGLTLQRTQGSDCGLCVATGVRGSACNEWVPARQQWRFEGVGGRYGGGDCVFGVGVIGSQACDDDEQGRWAV